MATTAPRAQQACGTCRGSSRARVRQKGELRIVACPRRRPTGPGGNSHMDNPSNPKHSKRKENQERREAAKRDGLRLTEDDAGNALVGAVTGIAVALMVLFAVWVVVQKQAAKASRGCDDIHPVETEASANADCKDQVDTNLTLGGIAVLIALVTGGGLYEHRTGGISRRFRRRGRGA